MLAFAQVGFNSPEGVTVDLRGNVFVADTGNDRIMKFKTDGTFIKTWGSFCVARTGTGCEDPDGIGGLSKGDGQFLVPYDLATDSSGNVYVAEFENSRIQKFKSDGTFIRKWGSEGKGNSQFGIIRGIGVDSAGNVYVAEEDNDRIQKFKSDGTFIRKWGTDGSGNGQFQHVEDAAISPKTGNVYTVESGDTNRVQVFTSGGKFLFKWGSSGGYALEIDSDGNVYVLDGSSIQKFNSNGAFIRKGGSTGTGIGKFQGAGGIGIDRSANNVFVADTENNRIQEFTSGGKFIRSWGTLGSTGVFVNTGSNVLETGNTVSPVSPFGD